MTDICRDNYSTKEDMTESLSLFHCNTNIHTQGTDKTENGASLKEPTGE